MAPALIAAAALVMGLPTLGGSFVGGDDHRLVLNHVLVNHPSWAHFFELFTILHRDLYQPLALASFQAEFAVANALGLFDSGLAGGAWLFHLTNIVLHVANTLLVWAVVRRLHDRMGNVGTSKPRNRETPRPQQLGLSRFQRWDVSKTAPVVAVVAALLFAVHPLQTEVVAWTNGRMMLLSTLFALASLLSFMSCLDRPRAGPVLLTLLFVILCAVSKVRISLPLLLAIAVVARRIKVTPRVVLLWLACAALTGVFAIVNVWATANVDLFAEGAAHLKGSRAVRVLQALAFYFEHFVWPAGLASYYPTPPLVRWSDPGTRHAVMVFIPSLLALAWACSRSRSTRLGLCWFAAAIAVTLPFVPARNVLAADRYMYLPIVGLAWLTASILVGGFDRVLGARSATERRVAALLAGVVVLPVCIGICWHVGWFYATPLRKTQRIADLFPDVPRIWEPVGWTHHSNGNYHQAKACAQKELRHDAPAVRSGAHQLLGMSELRLGNADAALDHLRRAVAVDPRSAPAKYRLATAYDELGRLPEALPYYEAAVALTSLHNPRRNRLASVYHRMGRPYDAREMYEIALRGNAYDVTATLALAELDITEGTAESYSTAQRRLETLLRWMPENTVALTNLGVVHSRQGRSADAVAAYEEVLHKDPGNVTAALNLAQIHHVAGDVAKASSLFERAVAGGLASVDQAVTVHDFLVSQEALNRAVTLWDDVVRLFPDSTDARAMAAWSRALAGSLDEARRLVEELPPATRSAPLALATRVYVDLAAADYDASSEGAAALCDLGDNGADARGRLLGALERFDRTHPDVPWTFCLAGQLLVAEGNSDAATVSLRLCEERCRDNACNRQVRELRARLSGSDRMAPHGEGPER